MTAPDEYANETSDTGIMSMDELTAQLTMIADRAQPITGNGDTSNPLRKIRLDGPPLNPCTITQHAEWLELRSSNLSRWAQSHEREDCTAILLQTLARMEHDIRSIRSLLIQEKTDADEMHAEFAGRALTMMNEASDEPKARKTRKRWFKW